MWSRKQERLVVRESPCFFPFIDADVARSNGGTSSEQYAILQLKA